MNMQAKAVDEKFCGECGVVIKSKAEICPKCGVRQAGHSAHINLVSIGIQNFPPIGVQFFPLFSLVERGFYDA